MRSPPSRTRQTVVEQRRPKHVPERSCVVCRQKRAKWELVRVVRTPQGAVEIDPRGKKAGRGAYLCKAQGCWETALKKRSLERTLKAEIVTDVRAELVAYSEALPASLGEADMAH